MLLGDVVQVDLRRWRAVMAAVAVAVVVVDSSVSHPGLRTPGGGGAWRGNSPRSSDTLGKHGVRMDVSADAGRQMC